jgi:hypothetical protein
MILKDTFLLYLFFFFFFMKNGLPFPSLYIASPQINTTDISIDRSHLPPAPYPKRLHYVHFFSFTGAIWSRNCSNLWKSCKKRY